VGLAAEATAEAASAVVVTAVAAAAVALEARRAEDKGEDVPRSWNVAGTRGVLTYCTDE